MSYLSGVRTDWVQTRLQRGDMLSTLATLYSLGAKEIVLGNGVAWNSNAIEGDNGWVRAAGSRVRIPSTGIGSKTAVTPLGYRWVFDDNSVILLPRGGPRSEVSAGTPTPSPIPGQPPITSTLPGSDVEEAGLSVAAIAIGVAGLAFLVLGAKKKEKKRKGAKSSAA